MPAYDFCNLRVISDDRYPVQAYLDLGMPFMHALTEILSSIPLYWWILGSACLVLISALCARAFESEASRAKRAQKRKQRGVRVLADTITTYGRSVHQRFPTGAVVVSEKDLAEQLRKHPALVVTGLNLLLNERKVQTTQLSGYWKLNV